AVADTFDPSIGVELLRAIKVAFEARGMDRITSAGLITDILLRMKRHLGRPTTRARRSPSDRSRAYSSPTGSSPRLSGSTTEAPQEATCWSGSRTSSIASVPLLPPGTQILSATPQQTCFHKTFRRFHPQQAKTMLRIKMTKNPLISTMLRLLRMKTGGRPQRGILRAQRRMCGPK